MIFLVGWPEPVKLQNLVVGLCTRFPSVRTDQRFKYGLSSGYGANMDQIISALDDLKGGKEWRTAAETESSENRALKTTFLENLVGLYCIVPRDHYEDVYDSVLDGGAPVLALILVSW